MKLFILVLARDGRMVGDKVKDLKARGFPYLVVCGERLETQGVAYREALGKWDAINFGYQFVPHDTDVVAINDVDTAIHGLDFALALASRFELVYCAVRPGEGPQKSFYAFADPLRERLNLFASGELMLIRKTSLDRLMPIPPCMAEDSYLLIKAMELHQTVKFCRDAYVTTSRTANAAEEIAYKERTTLGILQALDYAKPSVPIRMFYLTLPLLAIPLMLMGENGRAWGSGISRAVRLHTQGSDRTRF
jgi:hypothetical protein